MGTVADSVLFLVPRRLWDSRLFFMLRAFIDDSGNNDAATTPIMVLAGFVARADAWIAFEAEWHAALSEARISCFKMRDCYAKRGGFAGWGDERRDRFLLTLVEIIRRHVLASVFSLVRPDEYKEWVASHGTPKGLASPYFVLYYAVISAVLRSMRSFNMDEKVEFVFDEQFNLSDRVQAYYTEAVRLMEPTLVSRLAGRPIHKSDENTPELQAADLFAWHVRRCHHESALGGKFETPSVVLLKKIPFWGMPLTKEALLAISDFAAEEQFKLALKQEIREITRKVLAEALADFDLANEGEPSQPS